MKSKKNTIVEKVYITCSPYGITENCSLDFKHQSIARSLYNCLKKYKCHRFLVTSKYWKVTIALLQLPKHFVEALGTYLQNKNHFSGSPSLQCQHT